MVQNNHPAGDDGQLQPPFQVVDVVFRRRDMLVEPMAAAVIGTLDASAETSR